MFDGMNIAKYFDHLQIFTDSSLQSNITQPYVQSNQSAKKLLKFIFYKQKFF